MSCVYIEKYFLICGPERISVIILVIMSSVWKCSINVDEWLLDRLSLPSALFHPYAS